MSRNIAEIELWKFPTVTVICIKQEIVLAGLEIGVEAVLCKENAELFLQTKTSAKEKIWILDSPYRTSNLLQYFA